MKPIELARKLNSCSRAAEFVNQYETIEEAWAACPRGDWMLWTAARLGVDKRILVGVFGKCARTVQHLMKDPRSIAALDACDKYAAGEISEEELRAAYAADAAAAAAYAYAAYADAADAAAAAYAYAAYAYAADAATAAYADAADAAAADAAAAYAAAAYDAAYDAAYAARKKNQLQTANICREFLTDAVMTAVMAMDEPKTP